MARNRFRVFAAESVKDGARVDNLAMRNLVRLRLILVTQPLKTLRGLHSVREARARPAHGPENSLGPWVVFASGDVLEKALVYLGMTPEQLERVDVVDHIPGAGTFRQACVQTRMLLLNAFLAAAPRL
jgi:hypothetical protein